MGKCDSKREINTFWEKSPFFGLNKQRQTLRGSFCQLQLKEDALSEKEQDVLALQRETQALVQESGRFTLIIKLDVAKRLDTYLCTFFIYPFCNTCIYIVVLIVGLSVITGIGRDI